MGRLRRSFARSPGARSITAGISSLASSRPDASKARNYARRQHVPPPNRRSGGQPEEADVGKGILLWLLGIPLPIIIILLLIWH